MKFLLSIWQFPQHLLGLIMLFFYLRQQRIRDSHAKKYSDIFIIDNFPSGMSLGPVIFVRDEDELTIKHELGHSVQSRILGPLYLIVIGLPSLIWNKLWKPSWKHDYYWFWTERWADKLSGIKR